MSQEILQEGQGNFLRLAGDAMDEYSDKIFTYNQVAGFLPLEVRWINGKKECIYDVTGKISLRRFFMETTFTVIQIKKILLDLLEMAERVEEYLLDGERIAVNCDLLYFSRGKENLFGIYASKQPYSFTQGIGHMMEEIMEYMNQKDRELVFFVYGMHKLTKEDGCTRRILREYIMDAASENEEETGTVQNKKEMTAMKSIRKPLKRKTPKTPEGKYVLPSGIAVVAMILAGIIWYSGVLRLPVTGQIDWEKTAGVAAFLSIVAGYGVWKTWPVRGKRGKMHTIMERAEADKKVCLIPRTSGQNMIPICEFPFLLDSLEARIEQEGGLIYIVDEESREGVFRNDDRLVPWQKTVLLDGDIVRFAKNEFVVEITQSGYVI